jgi:hypothetical protein
MKWDIEEVILLVDLYNKTKDVSTQKKEELISNFSFLLINRAKLLNFDIDDKFRNIPGIKMQLQNIIYLVTDGKKGLSSYSEVFKNVVDMYLHNNKYYNEQLTHIFLKNRINFEYIFVNSINSFSEWLFHQKKFSASAFDNIIKALEEISDYALKTKNSSVPLMNIKNEREFNTVYLNLSKDKIFKIKNNIKKGNYLRTLSFFGEYLKYKPELSGEQPTIEVKRIEETQTQNELANIFLDPKFKQFLDSLIKDSIMSVEDLKKCNIRRYINSRNLYLLEQRNEILEEINRLLKIFSAKVSPSQSHPPEVDLNIKYPVLIGKLETVLKCEKTMTIQNIWNGVKQRAKKSTIKRILQQVSWAKQIDDNTFEYNYESVSFAELVTIETKSNITSSQKVENNCLSILTKYFPRGFKLNSAIDTKKFKMFYAEKFNTQITQYDETISKILLQVGIEYDADRVMSPENAIDNNIFLYYKPLFVLRILNNCLLFQKFLPVSSSVMNKYFQIKLYIK